MIVKNQVLRKKQSKSSYAGRRLVGGKDIMLRSDETVDRMERSCLYRVAELSNYVLTVQFLRV